MSQSIIPILILNGRPASGKSEMIAYLNSLSAEERHERYHLGNLYEIDDFPMIWTWFEEDALLEKLFKRPRLHTDEEGYFLFEEMWHLLIERISLEYDKLIRDQPGLHDEHTVLIEFARGTEHGGYRKAYPHLNDRILQRGGILYLNVSFEESLRKNRRRFNPQRPDSILEHGLPDAKLERMYKAVDWHDVTASDPHCVNIRGFEVPYVVFENEGDLTTRLGAEFEAQLTDCLDSLWTRLNR